MNGEPPTDELLRKVWEGQRIGPEDALRLAACRLEELGCWPTAAGNWPARRPRRPRQPIVTYIVDRNVNYTNVCNVYCKFCAFYRTEPDADAYVITLDEMDRKIEETIALGGTQILMQGGHHPKFRCNGIWICSRTSKPNSRRSTSTVSAPASSSISATCSGCRWRRSFRNSSAPASVPFPVAAGKSWWTASAGGFRRSKR